MKKKMKLSISNIGWSEAYDSSMYNIMSEYSFLGLEIAPTRVFPENPYDHLIEAKKWREELQSRYGFTVTSMQSIWYGRSEKLFGSNEEREILTAYTQKAIDFAEAIGCGNLVFGCPGNRSIPSGRDVDMDIILRFFRELGDYAYKHHTVIAMEANPPIYNTNFLNTTKETIAFIENVDSKGVLLNLDVGTMVENGEDVSVLKNKQHLINHIHISEPGLKPIQKRKLHKELAEMLRGIDYQRFVSIETGRQDDKDSLVDMMKYIKEIFE